ncbi:hypothetical protein PQ469_07550 [Mucilaginibacter sp. KACC 22773]|uniref:hypothetical protein n=1 Tax=Mucilaginibacter sp. KACC 22773 TaxID=3025671 RepID=UPI002365E200|nr:hypothetical protein [Mucilaginibacter sp. KACC 22773]WDF79861.1 hypothetical protein PQ469_07550 [Mucilaginibacter sp. KACC 22773]
MLTNEELNRILNWLPYRDDWPIDRNKTDDGINIYYGDLVNQFRNNIAFESYITQDGEMSNFIGFLCYLTKSENQQNAVLLYINLCAPVAAYGQVSCIINGELKSWGFLKSDDTGFVKDTSLTVVEDQIKNILYVNNIAILDKDLLSRPLPRGIITGNDFLLGDQLLDGIFQTAD